MIVSTYNLLALVAITSIIIGFYLNSKQRKLALTNPENYFNKSIITFLALLSLLLFSILAYSSVDIETDTCQKTEIQQIQSSTNQTDTVETCTEYQNVRNIGLVYLWGSMVLIAVFLFWLSII
jgi:hypothetical protein